MSDFNASLQGASLAVLRRELREDERTEFLELAASLGMDNVEDYIYMLMVFKRNEDRLSVKFEEVGEHLDRKFEAIDEKLNEVSTLETRIYETLDAAVSRILSEGARRIGSDMGDEIASQTKNIFSAVGAYHSLKGQIIVACAICGSAALGYFLGWKDVLRMIPGGSVMQTLLYLPAGWCFFLCGATYTFLWIGDNWYEIKRKKRFKAFLGGQIIVLLLLLLSLI